VLAAADDYRAHCSPEGRFSHYITMAGANGRRLLDLARRALSENTKPQSAPARQSFSFNPHSAAPNARLPSDICRRCAFETCTRILAMLVTPFTDDYRLNEMRCGAKSNGRLRAGAHGVVAAPSIVNFCTIDEAERTRVFEIVIEETSVHADLSAVAMTSGATTLETLRYAKIAARLGYDAQQVIPPYYWRCGEAEVERHYRMIAESGDLPVVIYHNPALSQVQHHAEVWPASWRRFPASSRSGKCLTDCSICEALYDEVDGRADIYQYGFARCWRG